MLTARRVGKITNDSALVPSVGTISSFRLPSHVQSVISDDDGYLAELNFVRMFPQFPLRGKPLILHVEDNKAQADMLKNILEGSGFAVVQASTAEEALCTSKHEPSFSLVLADHMLSGKTGTQLAAEIKKVKCTVPVVMHSRASLRQLLWTSSLS